MTFAPPPSTAAWRHRTAREGFEVAYFRVTEQGVLIDGCTTAVEDGAAWTVDYRIALDTEWRTRRAQVAIRKPGGWNTLVLDADGAGSWLLDGMPAPLLDGCLDVDLESSALTNALPVHRSAPEVGEGMDAPAAYVYASGAAVARLEQRYDRIVDGAHGPRFDYAAPEFDFACALAYDKSGLVLDYPGIAVRAH
ncbi:putative glycolipid-binding domain-containing protein [Nocardia gipuzkoensis]|uniref:putative glycolipid-binding domain-containing protein n=1 Tax=Nocardia gipuzkoensis TaxID=2749991 RepID=UPI0015EF88AB|nr:putative glycolipid-binding domain-containing protein [Nocardia gipuzkoensis]